MKDLDIITHALLEIETLYPVCFYILDKNLHHDKMLYSSFQSLSMVEKRNDFDENIDFILCFGGDGTILKSLDSSIKYNAPVLGVNFGKLGFLSDSTFKELRESVKDLIEKKYYLESRMLLDICVYRGLKHDEIHKYTALNDLALFKGATSKLISLRLYENTQYVYETRSDGIVVSTPTGSTAYSLSAGGPIMSPSMKAMIVTPLNPHVLSVRPMVFSDTDVIELRLSANEKAHLQIDGINFGELGCNDKVVVNKSKESMQFIKLTQKSFYSTLRTKLNMG
jgi:NAD+ kinase